MIRSPALRPQFHPAMDKKESVLMGVRKTKGIECHGLPSLCTGPQDPQCRLRKTGPTLGSLNPSSSPSAAPALAA